MRFFALLLFLCSCDFSGESQERRPEDISREAGLGGHDGHGDGFDEVEVIQRPTGEVPGEIVGPAHSPRALPNGFAKLMGGGGSFSDYLPAFHDASKVKADGDPGIHQVASAAPEDMRAQMMNKVMAWRVIREQHLERNSQGRIISDRGAPSEDWVKVWFKNQLR